VGTTLHRGRAEPWGMRQARLRLDEADFAAFGIEALVETARAAGITTFDELACHDDGSVITVEVEAPMDEATSSPWNTSTTGTA